MRIEARINYNEVIEALKKYIKDKYGVEDLRIRHLRITAENKDIITGKSEPSEIEFDIIGELR